jgi:aspartyl-tRNA(Asn)/glutamyl-tRNA(Gln) amidotransferase subunit A
VARAAERFAQLGAHVDEVDPGFEDPREAFETLWFAGAARAIADLGDPAPDMLDPGLSEAVAVGRVTSALDYLAAANERDRLGVRMSTFHESWDLLLTPTLPLPAFEAGREVPDGWLDRRWTDWTPFTYPFNLTQQPAASVPCGVTRDGLPIGLQIVGPRYADALVLRAAWAFEKGATEWHGTSR